MRYAITDVGSNTVKISVYDDAKGEMRHVFSQSTVIGLAAYRRDGRLTEEGIAALVKILKEYGELASMLSVDERCCIATASLRGLVNADEVKAEVLSRCGEVVDVISGEREAELGFAGLKAAVGEPEDGLFLDLGGGSTELIAIRDHKPEAKISLPFGALKLYHARVKGLSPTEEEREAIKTDVENALTACLDPRFDARFSLAYVTGGTPKALGKLIRMMTLEDDGRRRFTASEIAALGERLFDPGSDFPHRAAARVPERIHLIAPGLIALTAILTRFHVEEIRVVYSGIRDGYVAERFGLNL